MLHQLGRVMQRWGDTDRAGALLAQSLTEARELVHPSLTIWNLEGLAEVAQSRGEAARAARLRGAAEALREDVRLPLAEPAPAIGLEAFAASWAEGRAMSWKQAVEYALTDRN